MIRTVIPDFWETLLEANRQRSELWGGEKLDLGFKFIEMIGELGEWANEIKKLERERLGVEGTRTTRNNMLIELGDFMITLALLFNKLDIRREDLDLAVASAFNTKSLKMDLSVFINAGGTIIHDINEKSPIEPSSEK